MRHKKLQIEFDKRRKKHRELSRKEEKIARAKLAQRDGKPSELPERARAVIRMRQEAFSIFCKSCGMPVAVRLVSVVPCMVEVSKGVRMEDRGGLGGSR